MSRRSLYVGQPTDAAAAVYTSTNTYTTITAATAFNGSGGAVTLDVYVVPSGDSAGDDNKVYEGLSLADGASVGLQYLVGQTLEPGDTVQAAASTTTTISMRLSGDIHG
ncbi:hypothetical protein [Salipiger thiooxidans]|jgi:hypothetical protein|uniref:hypothetical protein n=1 Tax=Salipiger thiooxidans TaxID=282683 RepID=UPI001CD326EF|nr:hypothetical protein [Salipiger thiooxidans]MCA0846119.1 hypothetical protein [Salipiger thiooxidans]